MATSRKKAEAKAKVAPRAGKPAKRAAAGGVEREAAAPSSAAKKRGKPRGSGKSGAAKRSPKAERLKAKGVAAKPTSALARAKAVAPVAATKRAAARPSAGAAAAGKAPKKRVAGTAAAAVKGAAPTKRRAAAARGVALLDAGAPHAVEGLSEEDQIRAAKYLPRELPKRLFEEERFVFPETYGVNRIRLLVRDPEWIFAYWDVSPAAMEEFAKAIGERALALSRLTLRIVDPVSGGSTDILLPPGARWWYVRTDQARRTYRAELGVTLPSGEFRRLADSNTVVTPRVGPSPDRAGRRMSYREARDLPVSAAAAASEAEMRAGVAHEPWAPGAVGGAEAPAGAAGAKGGASDRFRPGGASDTLPGASDTFRR